MLYSLLPDTCDRSKTLNFWVLLLDIQLPFPNTHTLTKPHCPLAPPLTLHTSHTHTHTCTHTHKQAHAMENKTRKGWNIYKTTTKRLASKFCLNQLFNLINWKGSSWTKTYCSSIFYYCNMWKSLCCHFPLQP